MPCPLGNTWPPSRHIPRLLGLWNRRDRRTRPRTALEPHRPCSRIPPHTGPVWCVSWQNKAALHPSQTLHSFRRAHTLRPPSHIQGRTPRNRMPSRQHNRRTPHGNGRHLVRCFREGNSSREGTAHHIQGLTNQCYCQSAQQGRELGHCETTIPTHVQGCETSLSAQTAPSYEPTRTHQRWPGGLSGSKFPLPWC